MATGFSPGARAQPSLEAHEAYLRIARRQAVEPIHHEAAAFPGSPSPYLSVVFRVPHSRLVFVQSRTPFASYPFTAEAGVVVRVFYEGHLVAEEAWRQTQRASTFEDTQSTALCVEGSVFIELAPGTYTYQLFMENDGSGEPVLTTPETVTVPDFSRQAVGRALLVRDVTRDVDGLSLDTANLGGQVSYGEPVWVAVPVGVPRDAWPEETMLRYVLRRYTVPLLHGEPVLEGPASPLMPGRLSGADATRPRDYGTVYATGVIEGSELIPVAVRTGKSRSSARLALSSPPVAGPDPASPAGYLALIDTGPGALPFGSYSLEVTYTVAGKTIMAQTTFQTHWRNRPLSLYDPDVAIRHLAFIEDRREIRTMLRGSRAEREAGLLAYWKPYDPTPDTEYNELMAEYYRRIDDAATRFRTGLMPGPDGLRTDRAHIYIVQGAPESVDRTFPRTGGVRETWIYADGRQFVFWAASSADPLELQRVGSP